MRLGFVVALALCAIVALGTPAEAVPIEADFVFMVDATGSMGDNITAVKAGLSGFITGLSAASVDARFAVVLYGGGPEIVQDFSASLATTVATFNSISVTGAVAGFQNNHNTNPEAGLEVIRMVLGAAPTSTLLRTNVGGAGPLLFRAGAQKNLILVTDEDSDRPFYVPNRFAGQTSNEPPSVINAAWQAEVDAAAAAVIANEAFINLLMNPGDNPSRSQYGDPAQDASDADFLNFNAATTLANLIAAGFGDSLEAQVLAAGLIGRSFNITQINTPNFIDNFFAAKVEEVTGGRIPEPGTMILMGLGLVGLVGLRRRKR